MKKISFIFLSTFILIFFSTRYALADEKVAFASAKLSTCTDNNNKILKIVEVDTLKSFLYQQQSPFAEKADILIREAGINGLDPYFIVAISGVESQFGKKVINGCHNPFGWGNGQYCFKTWESSITIVAKKMRENYYNKGADTIDKVGRIYAKDPTWATKVKKVLQLINEFEADHSSQYLLTI